MGPASDRSGRLSVRQVAIHINDVTVEVAEGTTVAAAILIAQVSAFRRSVKGERRGPLCGMGICYECRVAIDGEAHQKSCQILCQPGMKVVTDAL